MMGLQKTLPEVFDSKIPLVVTCSTPSDSAGQTTRRKRMSG
jgi:hypothetical protein